MLCTALQKINPKLSKVISKRKYLCQWNSFNLDVKSKLNMYKELQTLFFTLLLLHSRMGKEMQIISLLLKFCVSDKFPS